MIKISAIKFVKDNNTIIITGKRHCDCYEQLSHNYQIPFGGSKTNNLEEGFITTNSEFVNRYEAYLIAKENNQIISDTKGPILYSEDIY